LNGFALSDFSNVTEIDIPTTVTELAWDVFWSDKALKSINIPESVTKVDKYTFELMGDSVVVNNYSDAEIDTSKYNTDGKTVTVVNLKPKYGDVTCDGIVTAADAAAVLQKALNSSYKVKVEYCVIDAKKYADVNNDGIYTANDAANILQKVLNSSYKMPCEG
jgi:hypothetical protein